MLPTIQQKLWQEYVWHRQTLSQLAKQYHRSIPWVKNQLDKAVICTNSVLSQNIVAVADTTFFGRNYGVLVIRCPRLRKNLYFHEVSSETTKEYRRARTQLEASGYVIQATVIDGRRGVLGVFRDVPVQLCQFHQIAVIRRYLTLRPKLDAGKELRALTLSLATTTEKIFCELLDLWYQKWNLFLKEKTYGADGKHWQYAHRKTRSAYRSLKTNLPYLFTYQKYPELKIPNTTNSLDGFFGRLKGLLNVHRGTTTKRRYKLIQEILNK